MPRLLLLLPNQTYRAEAFLNAAARLGVEVVVATDQQSTLEQQRPGALVTLDFRDSEQTARSVRSFSRKYPIDAVVGVDDDTTIAAAAIAGALRLPQNSMESVRAAGNKAEMRRIWKNAGLPVPAFEVLSLKDPPHDLAKKASYPCVLKPLMLSASRGVIRANNESEFSRAFERIKSLLQREDVRAKSGDTSGQILVEQFIPGQEVAVEALLNKGQLNLLAIFDKPDPLSGPYFEETIYVTPSRLTPALQREVAVCSGDAARALGLCHGPVHAELRLNGNDPWLLEVAPRSIGGLCARTLRFGAGIPLEELILKHALGMEIETWERERPAAGVMMIPIPRAGVLKEIHGLDQARAVADIEEITITSHLGMELEPLPEGSRYLGFIFSRADTPERAEAALREAHQCLEFVIDGNN
ncbi:MAG: ATP-grasp domain-containing protein [Acidobacteria bacterium]|nr:ATP-grasp domain-containing protein [Acidobacteriota bacterium]